MAIESTGFTTPTYDFLEENEYVIKIAHPLKTRAIAEAKVKTDKIDANILGYLLRSNLLPTSYMLRLWRFDGFWRHPFFSEDYTIMTFYSLCLAYYHRFPGIFLIIFASQKHCQPPFFCCSEPY